MASDLIRRKGDPDFSLMPGLLPRTVRADVRALGRFVRLAEGIATSPLLTRSERLQRLEGLEAALEGNAGAVSSQEAIAAVHALRESLAHAGLSHDGPRRILSAFKRDAEGAVAETWADVLAYCDSAAAPVGRILLAFVGEDMARCGPPADALCAALRILKQLRDIEHTNDRPARLSIPEEYVRNAFISPTHLRALAAKGQTQAVIDRVLDGVDRLVGEARELPRLIRNRRLKIYVSIVLCRAGKLAARLRRADPLHETVGLTRWQRLTCMWINIAAGLLRP